MGKSGPWWHQEWGWQLGDWAIDEVSVVSLHSVTAVCKKSEVFPQSLKTQFGPSYHCIIIPHLHPTQNIRPSRHLPWTTLAFDLIISCFCIYLHMLSPLPEILYLGTTINLSRLRSGVTSSEKPSECPSLNWVLLWAHTAPLHSWHLFTYLYSIILQVHGGHTPSLIKFYSYNSQERA